MSYWDQLKYFGISKEYNLRRSRRGANQEESETVELPLSIINKPSNQKLTGEQQYEKSLFLN